MVIFHSYVSLPEGSLIAGPFPRSLGDFLSIQSGEILIFIALSDCQKKSALAYSIHLTSAAIIDILRTAVEKCGMTPELPSSTSPWKLVQKLSRKLRASLMTSRFSWATAARWLSAWRLKDHPNLSWTFIQKMFSKKTLISMIHGELRCMWQQSKQ